MSSNRLKLRFEIPPSINNDYIKPRAIMSKGRPMTMMYETQKAKKFKKNMVKLIKEEVKKQGFKRIDNKYTVVEWTFHFPRVNCDSNNYYKIFIDSITESEEIWEDDNISMMIDKAIYYNGSDPHCEVEIYYIDKIGIFENQEELNLFIEKNCSQCKKGNKVGQKGGCSIYKKALENRIQEEINMDCDFGDKICSKCKM